MTNIIWTEDAIRDLEKIDQFIAKRIVRKIDWLGNNFDKITPEPLSGEFSKTFKLRIGDWRVIYTVKEESILILYIGHRKEIYKIN